MKYCTNCGNYLEENSNVCINCGKLVDNNQNTNINNEINNGEPNQNYPTNDKKGMPRWLFTVLIFVVVFGGIGIWMFITLGNFNSDINSNNSYTEIENILNNKEVEKVGYLGETINNDTWKLTLNSAKYYDKIDGGSKDVSSLGKGYLVFFLDVENISGIEESFNNSNFSAIEDKYIQAPVNLLEEIEGYKNISGNVSIGAKEKYYIAFQVHKDWQNFSISYKILVGNDSDLTFKITSEQVNK